MNRLLKKGLSLIVVVTACTLVNVPAFAKTNNDINSKEQALNNISVVESYLEEKDTSVIEALEVGKNNLETSLSIEKNQENRKKIEDLIRYHDDMISEYRAFKQNSNEFKSLDSEYYKAMTIAAISYFDNCGYTLSSELLTHAYNVHTGSLYYPSSTFHLYQTATYKAISQQGNVSGSSSFNGGSTVEEKDAYYAIHLFDYSKNNVQITITDKYDFDDDSDLNYGDLVGFAVNTMYQAQQMGVITPFNLSIRL